MKVHDKDGNVLNSAYSTSGVSLTGVFSSNRIRIPFDVFYSSTIITSFPLLDNESGNEQGACTDGVYIYQILIGTSFSFIKYKISDGTYTRFDFGSSLPLNHGNDMAYNPNNRHIYVASMSSDGSVMEFDTDFNYIKTHYLVGKTGLPYAVWGLCFDQNTNHFYSLTGGPAYAVYDQNFNYLRSIPLPAGVEATAQGMETDGEYIYRVWYKPNKIDVSTMSGQRVAIITNTMSGEPETMMYNWLDNEYYMGKHSGTDMFYKVEIKQPND